MDSESVHVYPNAGGNGVSDLALIAAMNGGGFGGGMNNPLWMMFMYPFIMPFMSMWMGNGGFGGFGFGGNNGTGFLANQLNSDAGREVIMQAINGRADALAQLAQITHTSVDSVRDNIAIVNNKLGELGAQVGMSGLQVINSIQSGNASLAKQLCECCCENRLATCQQTNTLQSAIAAHDANVRLQLSQNEAADQLAVCQQTNALSTQAERNTNNIVNAIANQSIMINEKFCDLEKRELQSKIDALLADNSLLRSNAAITAQTQQFAAMLTPIQAELATIKAAQPATITLPNNQYSVVPTLFGNGATDFVSSYLAARLAGFVAGGNTSTGTTTTTPAA